jgi:outer membrane protein TolC
VTTPNVFKELRISVFEAKRRFGADRACAEESSTSALALDHRPDLAAERAAEMMAAAVARQQEVEAKPDASFSAGYERPNSGFSFSAFNAAGNLQPIRQTFNYAVFGMKWTLPVFNRNQGSIAAAKAEVVSARNQVTAVDLALRHEVTQALVRYEAAQARAGVYRSECAIKLQEIWMLSGKPTAMAAFPCLM